MVLRSALICNAKFTVYTEAMSWRSSLVFLLLMAFGANSYAAGKRILVHGHRGARARRPENTLPAFRYAIEQGVDVLELDVAVTKDNVAVVSHDPLINATICSG